MSHMFHKAALFNQPLNRWDVSSVKYMDYIFEGASSFDRSNALWYSFTS